MGLDVERDSQSPSEMTRPLRLALWFMAFNALLGVGLFLPAATVLTQHGLSEAWVGVLAGAFPLAEGLSAMAYPMLVRRISPRMLLLVGQLLCAASCLCIILYDQPVLLLLGRILGGAGGGAVAIAYHLVGKFAKEPDRVREFGQLTAASTAGLMIGLVMTSVAAAAFGGELGLRIASLLGAALSVAGMIACASAGIPAAADAEAPRRAAFDGKVNLLVIYGLNSFAYVGLSIAVTIWTGLHAELGVGATGLIFLGLTSLAVLFQAQAAGFAAARIGAGATVAVGLGLSCAGAAIFAGQAGLVLPICGLVIARLGYSVVVPTTLSLILSEGRAGGEQMRAGWAMFIASIGSSLGPASVGALSSRYSLSVAAAVLATAAAAGLIASLAFWARHRAVGFAPSKSR